MKKLANRGPHSPAPKVRQEQAASAVQFLPPLHPRRPLMIVMGIILAAWLGWLLMTYFTTVYPTHHENPRPTKSDIVLPQ